MKRTFVPVMYSCNNNCISCPVPRRLGRENPSLEDIKRDIDEILEYSSHIEFNGGEPTIRKDLLQILRYAESKGASEIGLLTNSEYFLYKNYADEISKIKNLKIVTTLYGADPKTHDAITRTPGSFVNKIKGIKNLVECKIPIELRILLHKMNYTCFDQIANFLNEEFDANNFTRVIIMNPKLTERAEDNSKVVAEKLSIMSNVLGVPVKNLVEKGFLVEIYHFPHCVLPESLWKYSKGCTSVEPEVVFSDVCEDCIKKDSCSRVWQSYLDIFGDGEFKTIK